MTALPPESCACIAMAARPMEALGGSSRQVPVARQTESLSSASKMPGLKGVLASEARPAETDVSRPEAAVGPD